MLLGLRVFGLFRAVGIMKIMKVVNVVNKAHEEGRQREKSTHLERNDVPSS